MGPEPLGRSNVVSVRQPVQRRSRERWTWALEGGVALIEEGGYEALTIAAVCERAGVPPRLIYERVSNKDALVPRCVRARDAARVGHGSGARPRRPVD